MNSSAKTTAISLLAAAALGAAVFTGCTVTSGTVDDIDGGTQPNKEKDAGATDNDAGNTTPDGGGTATCETKRTSEYIVSAACQACLDANCCAEQKTCFDIVAPDESKVDCNDYAQCIDDCATKSETQEQLDECYADCDLIRADGVQTAYEAIESCAVKDCKAECVD